MGFFDRFKKTSSSKKTDKKKKELKLKENKEVKEKKEDKQETTLQPKVGGIELKQAKQPKQTKVKKEDTKNAYKVIIRPLITEKATDLVSQNKYSFEVAINTNKIEVKNAIKALYNVEPLDVNVIKMRGKRVRQGRVSGKRKNWKKAIVTLKQGDKIEVYEGV